MRLRSLALATFFFIFFIHVVIVGSKAEELYGCAVLDIPGETYYLKNDVYFDSPDICFYMVADNITLDCQGHTIYCSVDECVAGILVTSDYTTVRNCIISKTPQSYYGWDVGIWVFNGGYNNIYNIEVKNKSTYYVGIFVTGNNNIINNISAGEIKVTGGCYIGSSIAIGGVRNVLKNSKVYGGTISLYGAEWGKVYNNEIFNPWGEGICFTAPPWYLGVRPFVYNCEVFDNKITARTGLRIICWECLMEGNKFYNNFVLSTEPVLESHGGRWRHIVYMNTTLTEQTNIIGGPYIGGNYWTNFEGTGFSDTCSDNDRNGICDEPFIYKYECTDYWHCIDIADYLPLAPYKVEIIGNTWLEYPSVFYINEENKARYRFNSSEPTDVIIEYSGQNSKVRWKILYDGTFDAGEFYDRNVWELTNVQNVEIDLTIVPLSDEFHGFKITTKYWNGIEWETTEFDKNEEYKNTPDYILVIYRYPPVTWPIEAKEIILMVKNIKAPLDKVELCPVEGNCTYDPEDNEWICEDVTCQRILNNLTITCRTCGEDSKKQVAQYWYNETSCDWLNWTLNQLKYWSYDTYHLISVDRDICEDYNIVLDIFPDFYLKGSVTSLDNRDKFIFINSSDGDEIVQDFADTLGLQATFDGGSGTTHIADKKGKSVGATKYVQISKTVVSGNQVTFYISNDYKKTVWLDEIRIPDKDMTIFRFLENIDGLYATHSGKIIPIKVSYDVENYEVIVTPENKNDKIPVEPTEGLAQIFGKKNVLVIGKSGEISLPSFDKRLIIFAILLVCSLMLLGKL